MTCDLPIEFSRLFLVQPVPIFQKRQIIMDAIPAGDNAKSPSRQVAETQGRVKRQNPILILGIPGVPASSRLCDKKI
jgi:hypothetical protein